MSVTIIVEKLSPVPHSLFLCPWAEPSCRLRSPLSFEWCTVSHLGPRPWLLPSDRSLSVWLTLDRYKTTTSLDGMVLPLQPWPLTPPLRSHDIVIAIFLASGRPAGDRENNTSPFNFSTLRYFRRKKNDNNNYCCMIYYNDCDTGIIKMIRNNNFSWLIIIFTRLCLVISCHKFHGWVPNQPKIE